MSEAVASFGPHEEEGQDIERGNKKESKWARNYGRLVVISPETPNSELAQRNVIKTDEEHRKLGAAVTRTVDSYRAEEDPDAVVRRLAEIDAKTPPYDFEKPDSGA